MPKKGYKQTQEHIDARAVQLRGRARPPEMVERVAAKNRGQKRSLETRKKMSKSHTGLKLSDSHKLNISLGMKKMHQTRKDNDENIRTQGRETNE